MKCPYVMTTIKIDRADGLKEHVAHWEGTDSSERSDMFGYWPTSEVTQHIMTECLQEECGAWQDGRCVRRA